MAQLVLVDGRLGGNWPAGAGNGYVVRAADAPQHFDFKQNRIERSMGMLLVDFGAWEDNVHLFSPSGHVYKGNPNS